MKIKNLYYHFIRVVKHKHWVGKYCFKCGIPMQGITHDMSKFAPAEFLEGARYYQDPLNPVDAAKEEKGYSEAWLRHKGRNKHHYEYWQDGFDKGHGGEPIAMPYKYAVEFLCDYLGTARARLGKNGFSYKLAYEWWRHRIRNPIAMHPATKAFIDDILYSLGEKEDEQFLKKENLSERYYYFYHLFLDEYKED